MCWRVFRSAHCSVAGTFAHFISGQLLQVSNAGLESFDAGFLVSAGLVFACAALENLGLGVVATRAMLVGGSPLRVA